MQDSDGVRLPKGETGSIFFHRLLSGAAERFAGALAPAALPPSAALFKRGYGDSLARFEAARLASPQRVAIARHLAAATLDALSFSNTPLLQALAPTGEAPATNAQTFGKEPRLSAEIPLAGKIHRGKDALALVERLHAEHHMTDAARAALDWIIHRIESAGGVLDLRDQRFALLGAAAEISPVRLLLAGGATVRWVDVKSPAETLAGAAGLSGEVMSRAGDDLLGDPRAIVSSLRRFAEDGPMHLGLFAYAPGASRELRIAAVMNAIVQSLPRPAVASVSVLISPTSPGEVQEEDRRVVGQRGEHPALWQRALALAKVLPRPGYYGSDGVAVARAIVSLQGQGYQAAQYLTKIAAAEAWATDGRVVSANVAGITNTRSLAHPLFQLAFEGAPAFGVRIFEPATTRALAGLLMLHDLLNPGAAARRVFADDASKARALRSQQIHGGVYDLPWQFEAAVRAAAVIGLARRPTLLLRR